MSTETAMAALIWAAAGTLALMGIAMVVALFISLADVRKKGRK
jgi:hypothetical protein